MHTCNDCHAPLTNENWSPSYERERVYVCRPCAVVRSTAHQAANRAHRKQYMAEYHRRHKAKRTEQIAEWQKGHRQNMKDASRRYHQSHIEKRNAEAKALHHAVRCETLLAYGHACTCCGETRQEFLAVDHVNNDGAAHRRSQDGPRGSGSAIYFWLKRRGFPQDRFRLLCHNCNVARGCYGYCPHEREREATA